MVFLVVVVVASRCSAHRGLDQLSPPRHGIRKVGVDGVLRLRFRHGAERALDAPETATGGNTLDGGQRTGRGPRLLRISPQRLFVPSQPPQPDLPRHWRADRRKGQRALSEPPGPSALCALVRSAILRIVPAGPSHDVVCERRGSVERGRCGRDHRNATPGGPAVVRISFGRSGRCHQVVGQGLGEEREIPRHVRDPVGPPPSQLYG
mmetsp:Transcript_4833/g.13975  ORF Transcript_4833/g.13975 Transcript_4833/m.13975 type:complete len:207 (-) Transcript_4833:462-1082(-)